MRKKTRRVPISLPPVAESWFPSTNPVQLLLEDRGAAGPAGAHALWGCHDPGHLPPPPARGLTATPGAGGTQCPPRPRAAGPAGGSAHMPWTSPPPCFPSCGEVASGKLCAQKPRQQLGVRGGGQGGADVVPPFRTWARPPPAPGGLHYLDATWLSLSSEAPLQSC